MNGGFYGSKSIHTLSYGVYIVSTWDEGRATGCTANSAIQVTSSPATVLVSINKDNYTNKCIAACGHFALSVLAENSDPAIHRHVRVPFGEGLRQVPERGVVGAR